jgi:hypothetical protein
LPGFSANWTSNLSSGDYPMSREQDDKTYSGVIGPKISTKTIAVGTIEVSSALRRTEIEDIKKHRYGYRSKDGINLLTNCLKQF